jgi:CDP-diacylglycerol pyrophosphatase
MEHAISIRLKSRNDEIQMKKKNDNNGFWKQLPFALLAERAVGRNVANKELQHCVRARTFATEL